MVTRGAGMCRVLEERHPPEEYERMRANDSQPLHVWQMDIAVRNDSGRWLEDLTASLTITAEWPPCTTWSGPKENYSRPSGAE